MNRLHRLLAFPVCLAFLATTTACKRKGNAAGDQPNVVRITAVNEPPELLVPGQKPLVHTEQMDAIGNVLMNSNGKDGKPAIRALDGVIAKYPNVGDAYSLRAALRCDTGDFQGAKADIEKALSGLPRVFEDKPQSDRNELLAMHAKLAFLAHDDATVAHDLHEVINSYSADIGYLTAGRVRFADKPQTACGWTAEDVAEWLRRSGNNPDAQVFQGMFYTAHASLDDEAKTLTERYTTQAVHENPTFAPAYFYAALGMEKIIAFKGLVFTEAQMSAFNDRLIAILSKAIELNPTIQKAYADRAEAYFERKNYSSAIPDYDHAIALSPKDAALWNDRAMAKEETRDKSGAVEDYTQSIALKKDTGDFLALADSLDHRADLYIKLDDYEHALADCTAQIAARLQSAFVFFNLDFIRKLYPEYAKVDDATLKNKLHRMLAPNFSDDNFEKTISGPQGGQPDVDAGLKDAYLKRADVLLTLKHFDDARRDYARAELFKKRQEEDRWRTPPALKGMAIDLQTLEVKNPIRAWLKAAPEEHQSVEPQPTRFTIDCKSSTVQIKDQKPFDPTPGTYAELVRDFFCPSH